MQASGEMPMPAPMLLAGWWGDKFNRLYLNNVKTPRLKRVNVTVDLLPERRVATIENAWMANSEVRPGDDVPVKVFLRPYRGDPIERDFTGARARRPGQGRAPHPAERRRHRQPHAEHGRLDEPLHGPPGDRVAASTRSAATTSCISRCSKPRPPPTTTTRPCPACRPRC